MGNFCKQNTSDFRLFKCYHILFQQQEHLCCQYNSFLHPRSGKHFIWHFILSATFRGGGGYQRFFARIFIISKVFLFHVTNILIGTLSCIVECQCRKSKNIRFFLTSPVFTSTSSHTFSRAENQSSTEESAKARRNSNPDVGPNFTQKYQGAGSELIMQEYDSDSEDSNLNR